MSKAKLQHVQPGEAFIPKAEDWNAFVDKAREGTPGATVPIPPDSIIDQTSTIWVYNATGEDIDFMGVIRIANSVPDPSLTEDLGLFENNIFVTGSKPDTQDSPWCIALEPIPTNGVGRALAAGCVQVKMDIKNADHKYAKSIHNDLTKLESDGSGSAEIIYKKAEGGGSTGEGYALIRFPFGKGGYLSAGDLNLDDTITANSSDPNPSQQQDSATFTLDTPIENVYAIGLDYSYTVYAELSGVTPPGAGVASSAINVGYNAVSSAGSDSATRTVNGTTSTTNVHKITPVAFPNPITLQSLSIGYLIGATVTPFFLTEVATAIADVTLHGVYYISVDPEEE